MKTNLLSIAIQLVANGFADVLDKGGQPYFLHCYRVAESFIGVDDELAPIALLHDVVEDKVCTLEELEKKGFSRRVLVALNLLTHDHSQSYDDYIKFIAHNEDARKVKLQDLKDNSDISRLKGFKKKDFDRIEKYHRSYEYLKK